MSLANPAAANDFSTSIPGATASWDDSASRLTANDTAIDGVSAVAQLRRPNGNIVTVVDNNGADNGGESTTVSISEDVQIDLRACKKDGAGAIYGCGAWQGGYS